jgi:hypothetical protein
MLKTDCRYHRKVRNTQVDNVLFNVMSELTCITVGQEKLIKSFFFLKGLLDASCFQLLGDLSRD